MPENIKPLHVVCGNQSYFEDDVEGFCVYCKDRIMYRPSILKYNKQYAVKLVFFQCVENHGAQAS